MFFFRLQDQIYTNTKQRVKFKVSKADVTTVQRNWSPLERVKHHVSYSTPAHGKLFCHTGRIFGVHSGSTECNIFHYYERSQQSPKGTNEHTNFSIVLRTKNRTWVIPIEKFNSEEVAFIISIRLDPKYRSLIVPISEWETTIIYMRWRSPVNSISRQAFQQFSWWSYTYSACTIP
jgi:hypothetical protein